MNAIELEKFYDDNIAPDLLRLAKLCQDNGLSFVAGVDWGGEQVGRTATLRPHAPDEMKKANLLLQGFDVGGMVTMTITTTKP